MKVRNKKTGAIYNKDGIWLGLTRYTSLAELNEEWEDYREPNIYYFIDIHGEIKQMEYHKFNWQDDMKQIGNHFETREEAEKAVEKLKAFKRLKDLGFRFDGIRFRSEHNYIEWKIKAKNELTDDEIKEFRDALQKVFGGKE